MTDDTAGEEAGTDREPDPETETDGGAVEAADGADPASESDETAEIGLVEVRSRAVSQAEQVLSDPVEDVIRVQSTDDGWRVLIETLERDAVPDTQDILARYELTIDTTGSLTGYGLVERYRRGDMRGDL